MILGAWRKTLCTLDQGISDTEQGTTAADQEIHLLRGALAAIHLQINLRKHVGEL
jgi:hypothetical protein